ncbi:MAG: nuclear transport factor 2 family protein [Miltoncostaeaceae bacterium]
MSTQSVIEHHLAAFAEGDVDAMLEDYTEDSLLMTPEGNRKGLSELRAAFEGMLATLFEPGTYEFTMDAMHIEGDLGFIAWSANCRSADVVLGTDTFIVRDDKITLQTFAAHIEPK